jgi:phosphoadenosine phosphosulfate reductase
MARKRNAPERMTAKQASDALRRLQRLDLAAKVKRAREIIRAAIGTGAAIVAYSGGRDSEALAILARQIDPAIPLVYVDTGLADDRLTAHLDTRADLIRLTSPVDPELTWRKRAIPIGAKVSTEAYRRVCPELRIGPRKCCEIHKAAPIKAYVQEIGATAIITGARGDDSTRHRFKLMAGEVFPDAAGRFLAYPLLCWKREDVLSYLETEAPGYPLRYHRGEELGCRACAVNLARHPNQLATLRHADPAYHRRLIVQCGFGLEILQIRYGLTRAGAKALAKRDGWGALIDAGALDRIPYPKQARK